jgi:fused signal recognition particle receptor
VILEPDLTQEPDLTKEPEPEIMPPEVIAPEPEDTLPTEPEVEPMPSEPALESESRVEPEPEVEAPQTITVPSLELTPESTEAPAPAYKIVPEPAANPNFMRPSLKVIPEPTQPDAETGETWQPKSISVPVEEPEQVFEQPQTQDSTQERETVEESKSSSSSEPVLLEPVPTQLEMPVVKPLPTIQTAPVNITKPQSQFGLEPRFQLETQPETKDIPNQALSLPALSEPIAAPAIPVVEPESSPPAIPDMLGVLDRVKGFFEGLRKQPDSQSPLLAPLLDNQNFVGAEEDSFAEDEPNPMIDAIPETLEAPMLEQWLQGTPNSL